MDDLDPEPGVLEPLPAHRTFLRAVGPAGGVGVGRPEHDHVAVLQAVLDRAVGLRLADAQRVAPVVRRTPVPALPAIRVVMDGGVSDRVAEAVERGEVVADVAPGVMRAVADGHGTRPMLALDALDLGGGDIERLVPRDALVAGDAALFRVARAVGIEIDPLHRVQQPVGRVDDRLAVLPVRRQRGLTRRRELHPARLDRPRLGVAVLELDRRRANDLAVLDVDEQRPAVGHIAVAHGAIDHARPDLPARGLAQHQRLGEPVGEVFRAVDGQLEVLLGVDLVEPIDGGHQQLDAQTSGLEAERDVGVLVQAAPRAHLAIAQREPAADLFVAGDDLRHQVALFEPRSEWGMAACLVAEELRQTEQDERKLQGRHEHAKPPWVLGLVIERRQRLLHAPRRVGARLGVNRPQGGICETSGVGGSGGRT